MQVPKNLGPLHHAIFPFFFASVTDESLSVDTFLHSENGGSRFRLMMVRLKRSIGDSANSSDFKDQCRD